MNREKLIVYFLLSSTLFFALFTLYMLLPFLVPLLWAGIAVLITYPAYSMLNKVVKSRTISALLMTVSTLFLVVGPFFLLGIIIVRQATEFVSLLINYFQNHSYIDFLNHPSLQRFLSHPEVQTLLSYIQREAFKNVLLSSIKEMSGRLGDLLTNMILKSGSVLFKTLVFLLAYFFLLRDWPKLIAFFERFLPVHKEDIREVFSTIYRTTLAVIYGSVGVALIQAILGFIGYLLLGIDYTLLWAMLTFVASFIPPFGASLVWFPIAVYAFFTKGHLQAIIFTIYSALFISTADNFVRPLIMKKGVELPYLVVFLSTIGGLLSFGFIGLFLGPIIFATTVTLILIYEKRILNSQKP
ncbi:AI-2E family transporter [Thermocrinis minervae]|uniref:Predicted PurR-regulated permease PerM n=1 Tax=Thermocrinis minervae TaxID=381751 RepID=A0A1M6SCK2_9AQUI|nr:AI-2E family transporter [Thermocrinis minervae]SHK42451.1 Predicted PurR-regulated permease PerM [Thermocrinis minervae]